MKWILELMIFIAFELIYALNIAKKVVLLQPFLKHFISFLCLLKIFDPYEVS